MGLIKSLSIGVGVNSRGVKKGLRSATKQVNGWVKNVAQIAGGTAIGNLAGGAISKGFGAVKNSIESAFSFAVRDEQLQTAFSTLLGGADKATKVLGDLRKFGANTPFEFPGIADSAKKLISFGFQQKQLIPTLTKLGDVAAGLGIPFSDLADIYGKARVQGKVMSEDLNQLAGRGIPIFDELAKVMGVPAGEIKDLASKGKIGFAELQKSFDGMTGQGGRFSGMMAAQSQTAGGLISTLKDNWNLRLGEIGAAMFKTFDIKALIGSAITKIQEFGPTLTWLLDEAVKLKPVFTQSFNVVASVFSALWGVASSVVGAIASLFGGFGSVTMDGFVRGFVTGLAIAEFGFLNWQKIATLVFKTVAFRMVAFGNQLIHLFTKEIPAAFIWWSDNGLDIMLRLAANALTVFENLGSNIVSIFANLPGLISGTTNLSDILTPINKGLIDVVTNALELPERVEGSLERALRQDLESLQSEIGEGLANHVGQRLEQLIPTATADLELNPPQIKPPTSEDIDAGQTANTKQVETQFAGLAESGTQEYRDALLRFRGLGGGQDSIPKEQRDLQRQQLEEQKITNRRLKQTQQPAVIRTIPGG